VRNIDGRRIVTIRSVFPSCARHTPPPGCTSGIVSPTDRGVIPRYTIIPGGYLGYSGQNLGYPGRRLGYPGRRLDYYGRHLGYYGRHLGYYGRHLGAG
jgi:hypothetical protein